MKSAMPDFLPVVDTKKQVDEAIGLVDLDFIVNRPEIWDLWVLGAFSAVPMPSKREKSK